MGKDIRFESAFYTNSRTVGKDHMRLFWVGEVLNGKNRCLS